MQSTSNRHWLLAALLVAVFVLGTTLSLPSAVGMAEPQADNDPVEKLLKERQSVLQQLVEVQIAEYRTGNSHFAGVVQARQQLLEVELELARDAARRIKLLEDFVRMTDELHKIAEAQFKAGNASIADVLQSKALALGAQTELLRARRK